MCQKLYVQSVVSRRETRPGKAQQQAGSLRACQRLVGCSECTREPQKDSVAVEMESVGWLRVRRGGEDRGTLGVLAWHLVMATSIP